VLEEKGNKVKAITPFSGCYRFSEPTPALLAHTTTDFDTLNRCRLLFEHSYFPRFPASDPHVWFHFRELGPRREPLRGEQA
jgi:hypothetical protein